MADGRMPGFINDVRTQIAELLRVADTGWAALEQEYAAMTTNAALPTQADIDAAFGFKADGTTSVLTLQQFNDALTAQQVIVTSIHVPATRAKLYRVRR